LAEAYDATVASTAASTRLTNCSGRGQVTNGAGSLIAGFVIGGGAPETVLIRGVGPTLASFSVPNALADPSIQVFNSNGMVVAQNDNWGTDPNAAAAAARVGAFALPGNSLDAALVVNLAPGAYTVTVAGNNGATGAALAEVYQVQ
jgi:hypothetical protein